MLNFDFYWSCHFFIQCVLICALRVNCVLSNVVKFFQVSYVVRLLYFLRRHLSVEDRCLSGHTRECGTQSKIFRAFVNLREVQTWYLNFFRLFGRKCSCRFFRRNGSRFFGRDRRLLWSKTGSFRRCSATDRVSLLQH